MLLDFGHLYDVVLFGIYRALKTLIPFFLEEVKRACLFSRDFSLASLTRGRHPYTL